MQINYDFPWYLQNTEMFMALYTGLYSVGADISSYPFLSALDLENAEYAGQISAVATLFGLKGSWRGVSDALIYDQNNWSVDDIVENYWSGRVTDQGTNLIKNYIKAKVQIKNKQLTLQTLKEFFETVLGQYNFNAETDMTVTESLMHFDIVVNISDEILSDMVSLFSNDEYPFGKPTGISYSVVYQRLPDFQQLQYIQTVPNNPNPGQRITGAVGVDSGINPSYRDRVEIDVQTIGADQTAAYYREAVYATASESWASLQFTANGGDIVVSGMRGVFSVFSSVTADRTTLVVDALEDPYHSNRLTAAVRYGDKTGYAIGAWSDSEYVSPDTLKFFAGRTYSGDMPIRIYGAKIYRYTDATREEKNLIANFVPAKRTADGVLGLYNTETNTFAPSYGLNSDIPVEIIGGPVVGNL